MRKVVLGVILITVVFGIGFLVYYYGPAKDIREADIHLREAFSKIMVEYLVRDGSRTESRVDTFLQDIEDPDKEKSFSDVVVHIDFEKALMESSVEPDDFRQVQDKLDDYTSEVSQKLGEIYKYTESVKVEQVKASMLEGYDIPDKIKKIRTYEMDIGTFIEDQVGTDAASANKYLSVETEYGNLYVCSDFFFGKTDLQSERGTKLSFGYDEEYHIMSIQVLDKGGNEKPLETAYESILLIIPVSRLVQQGDTISRRDTSESRHTQPV